MSGVSFLSATTSQLITFVPWKCVDFKLQPWDTGQLGPPPPLRAASRHHTHRQAQHVVSHTVSKISLVGDIDICQNNYVEAANLYHPDGLQEPVSTAVADIEDPEGYSPGARRPLA